MTQCFKDHSCDTQVRVDFANLANLQQRMAFVLEAAKRFDQMLQDENRQALVQSINEIAAGTAP